MSSDIAQTPPKKESPGSALGRHLITEYYGCRRETLDDLAQIEALLVEAARQAGATPVKKEFHRFLPHGISGVVIIAESHLTIHTWPEHAYAAVDFFTCGVSGEVLRAHEYLHHALGAERSHQRLLQRGIGRPRPAPVDEAAYHEALVAPAFVLATKPLRRVAILGDGEGTTLREVLRFPEVERCVMLDSAGAFDDPRAEVRIEDAAKYLARAAQSDHRFDLIISDLPEAEPGSPLERLYSSETFELIKRCLDPGGIYVGQLGSLELTSTLGPPAILGAAAKVFAKITPYSRYIPSYGGEWVFGIAENLPTEHAASSSQALMAADVVDARLLLRRDPAWPCKTYDGQTHQRLFNLPKDLRARLK